MPTLVLENVPSPLYDQIQRLALARKRTPADTVLEVLETAFRTPKPPPVAALPPTEPFLTEEVSAPLDIPWPRGEPVVPREVPEYVPEPHDSGRLPGSSCRATIG
jgi:hypothetical protein